MADWQPFGYTGAPGTCKWCGRRLPRKSNLDTARELELRNTPGVTIAEAWRRSLVPADRLGGYQDDHFCGLRCGYQFGKRMADQDYILTAPGRDAP